MDADALLKKHKLDKKKIDVDQVIELLRQGERIKAVQLVLHQSGAGLKVSKDFVDDLMDELGIERTTDPRLLAEVLKYLKQK